MLLNGLNYLWLQLWAMPTGATPLASQLMSALVNSRLLDVAMALQAFAFNALLMLAWVPCYRGVLQRYSLARGEYSAPGYSYDDLYVAPLGSCSRGAYIPALLVVLVAILFFHHYVPGRTGQFCVLVLLYPLFVLLTQRLRALGLSPWLVLLAALPTLLAFARLLGYIGSGTTVGGPLNWFAVTACAILVVAGCRSGSSA
jgi:uncharacterized membrane protein YhaH (DUF805 family)